MLNRANDKVKGILFYILSISIFKKRDILI